MSFSLSNFIAHSRYNFVPDQVSCNALFDSLMDAKACNAAKLFLVLPGFVPDRYIRCLWFRKHLRTDLVWQLYQEMIEKGFVANLDVETVEYIIRAFASEAFSLFNDLKDRGYFPDGVVYTTMIHGLCDMKWIGEAKKLWFEMINT
ncbi:hypothetical protein Tsubulata_048004, partial [Turnera subulata]